MIPYTIFISCLSLSFPDLFMGVFLLIYSKKEDLGILYKIASFLDITFGTIIFLGGVFFASITTDLSWIYIRDAN